MSGYLQMPTDFLRLASTLTKNLTVMTQCGQSIKSVAANYMPFLVNCESKSFSIELQNVLRELRADWDGKRFWISADLGDWVVTIEQIGQRWVLVTRLVPTDTIAGRSIRQWSVDLGENLSDRTIRQLRHYVHVLGDHECIDALNITLAKELEGPVIRYFFGVCKGKAESIARQRLAEGGF